MKKKKKKLPVVRYILWANENNTQDEKKWTEMNKKTLYLKKKLNGQTVILIK